MPGDRCLPAKSLLFSYYVKFFKKRFRCMWNVKCGMCLISFDCICLNLYIVYARVFCEKDATQVRMRLIEAIEALALGMIFGISLHSHYRKTNYFIQRTNVIRRKSKVSNDKSARMYILQWPAQFSWNIWNSQLTILNTDEKALWTETGKMNVSFSEPREWPYLVKNIVIWWCAAINSD